MNIDIPRLATVPLFKDLAPAALDAIASAGMQRSLHQGEFLFLQGDPATHLHLLIKGQLKLAQTNADGQQVVMRIVSDYTLVGALAIAQAAAYPVSAEAVEDCTLLTWAAVDMMEFVKENPLLAMNAMRMMAEHAMEFQERLQQLATERVERRLAHTLLRLAAQSGVRTAEGVEIGMALSRQTLAEMCGMTLYTVSRLLSQWETAGIVIAKRERIIIKYPHGLVSIAEELPRQP